MMITRTCNKITMIPGLPEDVVKEILHKLPLKRAAQCRCVCKSWHNLLCFDPLLLLSFRQDLFITFLKRDHNSIYHLHVLLVEDEDEDQHNFDISEFSRELDKITTPIESMSYGRSCNGLICFGNGTEHDNPVYIANPVTGHLLTLPGTNPANKDPKNMKGWWVVSGFGFIWQTNEYILVKCRYSNGGSEIEAEILTFKLKQCGLGDSLEIEIDTDNPNSCKWRNIGVVPFIFNFYNHNAFHNGLFHWFGRYGYFSEKMFVSFDVKNQQFLEFPYPDPPVFSAQKWRDGMQDWDHLDVWRGNRLTVACYVRDNVVECTSHVDLWVMNEDEESWSRELVIKKPVDDAHLRLWNFSAFEVLKVVENGNLLLLIRAMKCFVVYNPRDGSFRVVKELNITDAAHVYWFCIHGTPSLVSLKEPPMIN